MNKLSEKKTSTRGRPKAKISNLGSFGPLADLIRAKRIEKKLGLADVAKACGYSVQFISNIEHGRASLPWNKIESISHCLDLPIALLQEANLAIRSDFLHIFQRQKSKTKKDSTIQKIKGASHIASISMHNKPLQDLILKFHKASSHQQKKFLQKASDILVN